MCVCMRCANVYSLCVSMYIVVSQLEDGDTYGSIQTTEAEKRKRASESLDFNMRDETFRDLFGDLEVVQQELQRRHERRVRDMMLRTAATEEVQERTVAPTRGALSQNRRSGKGRTLAQSLQDFVWEFLQLVLVAIVCIFLAYCTI